MKSNLHMPPPPRAQRGAILLVGLVTLLVLTIIGLHASRASTMSLIAATNSQEATLALAAAEESVVAGERQVLVNFRLIDPADDPADPYYDVGDINLNNFNWNALNGVGREFDAAGQLVAEYVVEDLGPGLGGGSITVGGGGTGTNIYRISGRGLGSRGTERIVQTIFKANN